MGLPEPSATGLREKLLKLRRESEERSAERLAKQLGYVYVDLSKTPASLDALKLIDEETARDAKAAAVEIRYQKVALAAVNPDLPAAKKVVEDLKKRKYDVRVFVATLSGLEQVWKFYKFIPAEAEEITGKIEIKKEELEAIRARLTTFAAIQKEFEELDYGKTTTTTLIETILGAALALHSSDIHFESEEKKARVRFRIDGILHDVFDALPLQNYENVISRVKLLSGMKINIRGEAQDGRFSIGLADKEIEIRVAVVPAEYGETIVMRILDPDTISIELTGLGLRPDDLEIVDRQIAKPNGLILNTGPTGSGKTTTLYAFLKKMNSPEIKIITLEDPIEYQISGIEQTQADAEAGYTFANGLRAIVRQDPDVILVGEIRDLETADIALQAALTGHMVFSTLHTNDAVGAVPRLVNLGSKVTSIGPALNLMIAQRLVRRLCAHCKKRKELGDAERESIKKFLDKLSARIDRAPYAKSEIYEAVGCSECGGFGYRGRVGIFEFLEGGPELEELILKEASEFALKKFAMRQGMVTMQEDGILKVLRGETSFSEVEGATGVIEWLVHK